MELNTYTQEQSSNCDVKMEHDERSNRESSFTATKSDLFTNNVLNTSQFSLFSENKLICNSPTYDSGNYSFSPIRSDASPHPSSCFSEDDNHSTVSSITSGVCSHSKQCHVQDETGKYLTSALREIDCLRSKLERYIKSESWYKNELRMQKKSKLDLLEKLYLSERKYVAENRTLHEQCETIRLAYEESIKNSEHEKNKLKQELQEAQLLLKSNISNSFNSSSLEERLNFDLEKQRSVTAEQEQIIEILRKQKHVLLNDLTKISSQKDSVIARLEAVLLTLEQENRIITQKCSDAIRQNKSFEETLRGKMAEISILLKAKDSLQKRIGQIESEISDLKLRLIDNQSVMEEKEQELMKCKNKISTKQHELDVLKSSLEERTQQLECLQTKLLSHEMLKQPTHNDTKSIANSVEDKSSIVNKTIQNTCKCGLVEETRKYDIKPVIAVKPRTSREEATDKQRMFENNIVTEKPADKIQVPNVLLVNNVLDSSDFQLLTPLPSLVSFTNNFSAENKHSISGITSLSDTVCMLTEEIRKLKVFHNVLEYEHRREISRYELYVGVLLKNVKSYKRALENEQSKIKKLEKDKVSNVHVGTNTNERNDPPFVSSKKIEEEVRNYIINGLKTKKKSNISSQTDRSHFIALDQINPQIQTTLTNLMDDYKRMLLYKRNETFTRSSKSNIAILIEKSNKCNPNLNSLVSSIEDLRNDLQAFRIKSGQGISLMDELKAVEEAN